jgi:hypothetical protein
MNVSPSRTAVAGLTLVVLLLIPAAATADCPIPSCFGEVCARCSAIFGGPGGIQIDCDWMPFGGCCCVIEDDGNEISCQVYGNCIYVY